MNDANQSISQIGNDKTFVDLSNSIDGTPNNGILYLNNSNYKALQNETFIELTKNITINGRSEGSDGYSTIDGSSFCRIFATATSEFNILPSGEFFHIVKPGLSFL